ncbi:MAG: SMI1/KNR4 family protein [Planctomycetaceae bacterium]|nr:SMI1/KNR4 family protein [Planctomycetaceae bacterium]
MNERDITRIEKVTQIPLPDGYRELILQFPPELKAILNLRPKDERDIFTDAATIIRWNRFFRSPDYEYENSYGEICTFPSHHIVIGANGGGDFFHLNVKRKRTPVLFWCHDDGEISVQSKNLGSFIQSVFRSTGELVADRLNLT